ncbi:hypothetical protein [Carbonactinospora thermoautotrophica]|uniref:Uncharacterized protein n=1 Tax=Carbonactinospora thermoautotrophica TaxID=1469144 RepID=A0A132MMB3_9ACTN|nr:hypothetical protein [Carbonactinospora thermoautotrophica]KWW98859.1 hypothetical protein LI90_489 [Carbonactinospora thermoautotrophica]
MDRRDALYLVACGDWGTPAECRCLGTCCCEAAIPRPRRGEAR